MKNLLLFILLFPVNALATDDLDQIFERMAKIDRFVWEGAVFLNDVSLQQIRELGELEEEVRKDIDNPHHAGEKIPYYTFRFKDGLVVVCRNVSRNNSEEHIQFVSVSITSPRWPVLNNLNVGGKVVDIKTHLGAPSNDTGERLEYQGETEEVRFGYINDSITKVDFLYYAD